MKFIKKIWWVILVLPALWPIFRNDFFQMHDFTHVARLIELDQGFRLGHLPPRWAPDLGWGQGMPLFHFYGPLPYYLAEVTYLIGLPAVWAIKTIFAMNYLAGFYFMYLWAKNHWGRWGGFVSGLALVYLPYRAVQFYVRGSLGELTAMTFIPLFYWAAGKKKIIPAALAWTGIFLSHNVIALFSLGFFCLYFLWRWRRWKQWLAISGLTVLLSAWFILPAFFEKNLTGVNSLTGGYFHYSHHFIYLRQLIVRNWGYGGSIFGLEDGLSFQLGWPHWLLILPAIFIWKRFKYFWLVLATSIFLMTFHSKFIWDALPILALAQFPWRLLAFTGTIAAFFSGSGARNKFVAAIAGAAIMSLNISYFQPKKFSPVEDYYYTDRQRIATEMSDLLQDYLPKNYADFPTAHGGKTSLEYWSDIISLTAWLGLAGYYVRTRIRT